MRRRLRACIATTQPIEIGRLQRLAMECLLCAIGSRTAAHAFARDPALTSPASAPALRHSPAPLNSRRRGIRVTVFEARPLPGGLNTYGVAEYKLNVPAACAKSQFIESLGVEVRCNEEIDTARLKKLGDEYDAIFLGVGLGRMQPLGIPGEEHINVVDALRYIADYKTAASFPAAAKVVVIGAGNTAIDAANAARRLGAAEVSMLYRRTAADMSAFVFEYEHAKQEGVGFHWLARPVRILSANGHLIGIECRRVCPPASFSSSPATVIVPAIGQSTAAIEAHRGQSVERESQILRRRRYARTAAAKSSTPLPMANAPLCKNH